MKALNSLWVDTVGINNPPVLNTDKQETGNLDKTIFS
jgi:hypothetical protein